MEDTQPDDCVEVVQRLLIHALRCEDLAAGDQRVGLVEVRRPLTLGPEQSLIRMPQILGVVRQAKALVDE